MTTFDKHNYNQHCKHNLKHKTIFHLSQRIKQSLHTNHYFLKKDKHFLKITKPCKTPTSAITHQHKQKQFKQKNFFKNKIHQHHILLYSLLLQLITSEPS